MIKEYIVKITDEVIPDAFARFEADFSPEREIIRCKDCKHGKKHNINIIECMKALDYNLEPREFHHKNWFCADGERKEGR